MKEEIQSMIMNEVWELVELPKNCKVIGYKWIYKTKKNSTSKIIQFKARLIAKDFTERGN